MSARVVSSGSIRLQLTLRLVLAAALLGGVLFLGVLNLARTLAQSSQDNILGASVTSILESARVQGGEIEVDIPYSALAMLGNVSDDRVFYRVSAAGQTLTGYGDLPEPEGPRDDNGRRFLTTDYLGDSVRVASAARRIALDGQPVELTVAVGQTRTGQKRALRAIWRNAALLGIGLFALTVVLSVLAAQATVSPLDRLAASVSRRGPQDLRPVEAAVPTEMVPLVEALNRFIARLQTTLERSEDFIAEAAHRVRTPLATVRAQAEVVQGRVEKPENRAALRQMIEAIDESSRAAGQLLDHAMVTFRADQLDHRPVDLSDLIAETVRRLQPVAGLKDIAITVTAPDSAVIPGDPILLQSAIGNILDNAIKYSLEEGEIGIELRRDPEGWRLSVADQGPGFPVGEARRLTRRFARGENAAGTVGSGLGLTIAREVAQAHGGRLDIDPSPEGGGACVSFVFPAS